jgi:exonuclease III
MHSLTTHRQQGRLMKQILMSLALLVFIFVCGWALLNKSKIDSFGDAVSLAKKQLEAITRTRSKTENAGANRIIPLEDENVRIASFNIQSLGIQKTRNPQTLNYLARICREFDLLAVQEIRADDRSFLNQFIEKINETGRQYDYVISPLLGRSNSMDHFAFIFDTTTIQLDAAHRYTINDPDDLMDREPFVAWFRARQANPDLAFTFTLVNVRLDSNNPASELDYLGEVFRAVRNDGRMEDDILIAGDFNTNETGLAQLNQGLGLSRAIIGQKTDTRASQDYDNLLFDPAATTEFTGRAGVFDFMQIFNLTLAEALEVSDHLPVWADFSKFEGGDVNRTANQLNSPRSVK